MGTFIDITGQTFGFLKVIEKIATPDHIKFKRPYWKCVCLYKNCGREVEISGHQLKNTISCSCGCYIKDISSHNNAEEALVASAKKAWRNNYSQDGLSFNDFLYLSQKPCEYCGLTAERSNCSNIFTQPGRKWASSFAKENGNFPHNGLDRIDSTKGHVLDNLLPCCWFCNKFKLTLSLEKFLERISNLNLLPKINIISIDRSKKLRDLFPIWTRTRKENRNHMLQRIAVFKSHTKHRGISISLTDYEIAEFIISPCAYCNYLVDLENFVTNSIDRIDNNIEYVLKNCLPACFNCNIAKNNHTLEDFLAWIHRIKTFQANKTTNSSIPIYQPSDLQAIIEAGNSI